jgi:hypothetical protein
VAGYRPWKGGLRKITLYHNIANANEFLDPLGYLAKDVIDECLFSVTPFDGKSFLPRLIPL